MSSRRSRPVVFRGTARFVRSVTYPRDLMLGCEVYVRVAPDILLALRVTEFRPCAIDESTITFVGRADDLAQEVGSEVAD